MFTYMQQTMNGLNYLHTSRNLVHLDLKPENVILDTKSNSVRLIDFGCAQSITSSSSSLTTKSPPSRSGSMENNNGQNLALAYENTEFLAPELVSHGPVGTYTDMWAFGVLLYVALRYAFFPILGHMYRAH